MMSSDQELRVEKCEMLRIESNSRADLQYPKIIDIFIRYLGLECWSVKEFDRISGKTYSEESGRGRALFLRADFGHEGQVMLVRLGSGPEVRVRTLRKA
jgi:hypothetical protein